MSASLKGLLLDCFYGMLIPLGAALAIVAADTLSRLA